MAGMAARMWLVALGAVCAFACLAPGALASSLVYTSNNNVWLANPDGSGQYQVTLDGSAGDPYSDASQANDGTIVAVHGNNGSAVFARMTQNGTLLNTPFTGSNAATINTTPTAVVSPDGSKLAYWEGYALGNCVVCGPQNYSNVYQVSDASQFTDPSVFLPGWSGTGFGWAVWLGNSRNLLLDGSATAYVYDLGAPYGANEPFTWFQAPGGTDWFFHQAAVSPDGTKLALLLADGTANQWEIVFYTAQGDLATGNPPAAPTLTSCLITPPDGTDGAVGGASPADEAPTLFNGLSWSPDGSSLAFAYNNAIYVAGPIDLTNCTGNINQVIANGTDPSWGPAAVNPAPRVTSGSGGSSNPGGAGSTGGQGGSGGHGGTGGTGGTAGNVQVMSSLPCAGLYGIRLQNCQAAQAYIHQLAACKRQFASNSSADRHRRLACTRKAIVTFHRARAIAKCQLIGNRHERSVCLAKARKAR